MNSNSNNSNNQDATMSAGSQDEHQTAASSSTGTSATPQQQQQQPLSTAASANSQPPPISPTNCSFVPPTTTGPAPPAADATATSVSETSAASGPSLAELLRPSRDPLARIRSPRHSPRRSDFMHAIAYEILDKICKRPVGSGSSSDLATSVRLQAIAHHFGMPSHGYTWENVLAPEPLQPEPIEAPPAPLTRRARLAQDAPNMVFQSVLRHHLTLACDSFSNMHPWLLCWNSPDEFPHPAPEQETTFNYDDYDSDDEYESLGPDNCPRTYKFFHRVVSQEDGVHSDLLEIMEYLSIDICEPKQMAQVILSAYRINHFGLIVNTSPEFVMLAGSIGTEFTTILESDFGLAALLQFNGAMFKFVTELKKFAILRNNNDTRNILKTITDGIDFINECAEINRDPAQQSINPTVTAAAVSVINTSYFELAQAQDPDTARLLVWSSHKESNFVRDLLTRPEEDHAATILQFGHDVKCEVVAYNLADDLYPLMYKLYYDVPFVCGRYDDMPYEFLRTCASRVHLRACHGGMAARPHCLSQGHS